VRRFAAQVVELGATIVGPTLTEAKILTETWRIEYNTIRPHSALDGHPPDEYAEKWRTMTATLSYMAAIT
jgi:transposase InsO family protein